MRAKRIVPIVVGLAVAAVGVSWAAAEPVDEQVTLNVECTLGTTVGTVQEVKNCNGILHRHTTTSSSAPSATSTTTAATTTTSSVPNSTTTIPATSAPTTVAATTTTSPAGTTTTTTPSGALFTATFDTPADFFDRFDRHLMSGANAPISEDWQADHNDACDPPPTERHIHGGGIHSGDNPDHLFFWCAPGGDPAKGHIMSTVLTGGVVDLSFSPRQVFTDPRQVCWDVNTTWLSSRKWVNVLVVPAAAVTDNGGRLDFLTDNDMGLAAQAGLLIDSEAPGTVRVKEFFGHVEVQVHTPGGHHAIYGSFLRDVDKATRYRHCLTDNGDGTLHIYVDRPNANLCGGPPSIYPCQDVNTTFPGRFPAGPIRVIFQDTLYDAPKGEVLPELEGNFNTWHWDNIIIRETS